MLVEARKFKSEEILPIVEEIVPLIKSLRSGFVGEILRFFENLISEFFQRN